MRWISLVIVMMWVSAASGVVLMDQGKSDYVIAAGDGEAVHTAAEELQTYLKKMSGGELKIVPAKEAKGKVIWVGLSDGAKKTAGELDWASLGDEGIVIKEHGGEIVLAGNAGRGTLNAVHTFLEDELGVRWWTSREETVPKRTKVEAPDGMAKVYVPELIYRETYNADAIRKNDQFATRMRLNGNMSQIPDAWGGHRQIIGWCHTSYALIPPGKYFAAHPEWFSEIKGKRITSAAQLCWSNEAMRHELAKNALAWIKHNPTAGIISISQNDCFNPCQCPLCKAADAEEGSASGALIRGVNAVAAEIHQEYPDFLVETLAYQWSRKPPHKTKPADNVLIRLCSIEADFAHPQETQDFGKDVVAWGKIAKNLFIWNYATSFADYLIPHPNWKPLGEDLRFYAKNHVVGVFEQGDGFNREAGDMLPLRVWLLAHLMWDPSSDQDQLTKEFLDGYYGAAGEFLGRYLALLDERSKSLKLGTYNNDTSFLSNDDLHQIIAWFDAAEKSVATDPLLLHRVQTQRLIVEHVRLRRFDDVAELKKTDPNQAAKVYLSDAQAWTAAMKKLGVTNFSEGQAFDAYVPGLLGRAEQLEIVTLPKPGKTKEGVWDIQQDGFALYAAGSSVMLADDPAASDGKAARMPGNRTDWAVQVPVKKDSPWAGKGPWKVRFVVKVEGGAHKGLAFTYGVYRGPEHRPLADEKADMTDASNAGYRIYTVVVPEMREGDFFWVAPPGREKGVTVVSVDRIVVERKRD